MSDIERSALEWDRALERLAAEVATTAYAIALRHGAGGSWLDLELGLWKALARTVLEWGASRPAPARPGSPEGPYAVLRPTHRNNSVPWMREGGSCLS